MNGLFDAPTGGSATNLTSGSPDYQNAIVNNTARQLKPAYAQALQQSNQQASDNGQLGGGINDANRLGLQQSYLGQIGNVATNAATQGADLAEQNRQREEQRGWQLQDRDTNLQYLRDQAQQQRDAADNAQWANLIGTVGGAVGGMYGGPMGAAAGQKAGQGIGGLLTDKNGQGSSGTTNPDYLNSSNPYGLK